MYDSLNFGRKVKYACFLSDIDKCKEGHNIIKWRNAIRMPIASILRAHATPLLIPQTLGMVLNANVRFFCHKIFNSSIQYWMKPNLLLFLVAIVVQLKFRFCWINLDFHCDCFSLVEWWYPTHRLFDLLL